MEMSPKYPHDLREIIEAGGIDADATPVDTFMRSERNGLALGFAMLDDDFGNEPGNDEPAYEQDYDAACRISAAVSVHEMMY